MPAILQYLTRALAAQKNVFAHVVVGNTAAHTVDTWARDIKLASDKGIDAFVLNIAYPDSNIPAQVSNAFQAAEQSEKDFKLFFSFDYLGGGAKWPATADDQNSVVGYMNKYKDSPAHFKVDNKPMISTFEGVENIPDWAHGGPIRNLVGDIHFVPDWSSLGPDGIKQHLDKIEGAFSWDMWPEGPTDKDIGSDEAWQAALGEKDYMMGVSPWFFRSAEGGKNWIWKGDDLWTYRWAQTKKLAPRFVQIVTWNDYGESHYIGPNPDASEIPTGSHDFVEPLAHTGWLSLLPYHISQYKGTQYIQKWDKLTFWYRDAPCKAGDSSWVVGNNGNQGQKELPSVEIMSDKIFLSSWLTAPGQVQVKIGNNAPEIFEGKQGFNHWSMPLENQRGVPTFSVVRNGATVYSKDGREISDKTQLANGKVNFNAFVGSF